ncbi:hypothetical protein BDW62DRAFT_122238 [Aspergillus aurantiobrunneus]
MKRPRLVFHSVVTSTLRFPPSSLLPTLRLRFFFCEAILYYRLLYLTPAFILRFFSLPVDGLPCVRHALLLSLSLPCPPLIHCSTLALSP